MLFDANIENNNSKKATFSKKNKQIFDESQKRETFNRY